MWVYAVHLTLPHEDRLDEIGVLLARAATRDAPTILAGDLNSCPSGLCPGYEEGVPDDVYARATARYQDAWVAAGNDPEDPAGYTYEATDPTERIDHILVSNHFRVERVRTDAVIAASDHMPVHATLRIT